MDDVQLIEKSEQSDKVHPVTVSVNGKTVTFQQHRVTGLEIKQTAIAQGVSIQLDFALFKVNPGGHLKQIGDNEEVSLHKDEEFRAVAPDDNS